VAQHSIRQAQRVYAHVTRLLRQRPRNVTAGVARLGMALAQVLPLVEQVVSQTVRRVLHAETVPATEKVVSLFEPHTRVIRRGKVHVPAEFGRKVFLDEVDGGIVSHYAVLDGNPPEADHVPVSLAHHARAFGRPPDVLAGDRGTYSPENERLAREWGVRCVALPQPGAKAPARRCHEQQRWFRRAHRFRAGVEGRISVLKRRGWLGRCRDRGEDGFHRWIGWGVITANLTTIARTTARRSGRP
jgi:IS5 family transposase